MSTETAIEIAAAIAAETQRYVECHTAPAHGDVLSALSALIEADRAELPLNKHLLLIELAQVAADTCTVFHARRKAVETGNTGIAEMRRIEIDRLQQKSDQIVRLLQSSADADELAKAPTLEAFRAALPNVPLAELHSLTHTKLSRFPLIWALSARNEPLRRVQLMLAAGARVDLVTAGADTILHEMAAMNRTSKVRLAILRLLIFKGAEVDAVNLRGETPLSVAVSRGSLADLGHFIAVGAKVRLCDLKRAVYAPEKLRLLIEHSAEVDPGLLAEAAHFGGWLRGEIAEAEERRLTAAKSGKGGFLEGRIAKLKTSLAMIKEISGVEHAGPEDKATWDKEPAAFHAVKTATTLDAFRAALDRVDVSTYGIAADGKVVLAGDHPIYWPIRARTTRLDRLWLMLAAGASVQGRTANGEALHIFAQERRADLQEQQAMARMLQQAGADVEAVQYDGKTPLALAVSGRGIAETTALLELGASTSVRLTWKTLDSQSFTAPLIFAAAHETRIFQLLLDHGADTSARDSHGRALADYLLDAKDEYARLASLGNLSGNLMRQVNRNLRALSRSLDIVAVA